MNTNMDIWKCYYDFSLLRHHIFIMVYQIIGKFTVYLSDYSGLWLSNIEGPHYCPVWVEFTGMNCRKGFHVMTSSWFSHIYHRCFWLVLISMASCMKDDHTGAANSVLHHRLGVSNRSKFVMCILCIYQKMLCLYLRLIECLSCSYVCHLIGCALRPDGGHVSHVTAACVHAAWSKTRSTCWHIAQRHNTWETTTEIKLFSLESYIQISLTIWD